jgi:hypothetical protein
MSTLRLTRASQEVGSFLSVLGSLRETRLTAVLGFLVSRFPEEFGPLLGFRPLPADEISVEETDAGERYDVLIRQSGETHIIEGKIGPTQRVDQLLRYVRSVRRTRGRRPALTVVDDGSEFRQSRLRAFHGVEREVCSLRFVTWALVAKVCQDIARKHRAFKIDRTGAVIADELATYLKENNMTTEAQPEIYLRDVSDTSSVQLYFRHHLYKCQSKFYNSARSNLYFAPYFTRQMASAISQDNLVPIGEGISFVSRVQKVQVIETRDVLAFLEASKHPKPKDAAEVIRQNHRAREVLLMTLGEPRLMFVSPVTKAKLKQVIPFGTGAMGSRSCTFDDLLAASQ